MTVAEESRFVASRGASRSGNAKTRTEIFFQRNFSTDTNVYYDVPLKSASTFLTVGIIICCCWALSRFEAAVLYSFSFSLVPSLVDPSETAHAEIYQGFVIHTRSITTVFAPL